MDRTNDLTKGSIPSTIFKLSWPIVAANILQSLYNIADAFWLGKLGTIAINAPTLSWPVIFLVISFAMGFGIAGTSFVSQHHGAGEEEMVSEAIGQTLLIMMSFSVVMSLVGFFMTDHIVRWMGASAALIPAASIFMKTTFLSTPFSFGFNAYSSILRGYGNTITPMKLSIISVVINAGLDPLMIFGLVGFPKMGVFGAALATLITQAILMTYSFYLLFTGKNVVRVRPKNFVPKWDRLSKLIKVGFPLGLSQSGQALGFVVMTAIITSFGNYTLAAFGVGNRVISIATMFSMGISMASAAMIGQNLGAGKVERAERTVKITIMLSILVVLGLSAMMIIFRNPLIRFFINDSNVVKAGSTLLIIVPLFLPFFAIMQSFMSAFNGSGHTVPSMWLSISRLWFMRIPLIFVIGWTLKIGANGVWWAMGLSNVGGAILALMFFLPGTWKTPKAMFNRP